MVKIYKQNQLLALCPDLQAAYTFILDNAYKIYTIYCGGRNIIIIEVIEENDN